MEFQNIAELVALAEEHQTTVSDIVITHQQEVLEIPREELIAEMAKNWQVMNQAIHEGLTKDIISTSGLTGGDGRRLERARLAGKNVGGDRLAAAAARALAVAEVNAAMGKIVAAPTAGSCGILPGVITTVAEAVGADESKAVMSLFTAAGIGLIIARNASISGAAGGCQAECGSASAMAAAAAVELAGGTPEQVAHAAAIALKNLLGLVCDPVAGLVEVPCIKRNAGGAVNALLAADMALAGVKSVIPPDEVVQAMYEIGQSLPSSLKETALGGLAKTPTGLAIKSKLT